MSNISRLSSQSLQVDQQAHHINPTAQFQPCVHHFVSLRDCSLLTLGQQAVRTSLVSTAQLLQQVSAVYRSLAGLGFIVADAVSEAQVGYAQLSTLSLNTLLLDETGSIIRTDQYATNLPLSPRDGIPIAKWKPLIFVGGIVLAETIRMLGAWIEQAVLVNDEKSLVQKTIHQGLDALPQVTREPLSPSPSTEVDFVLTLPPNLAELSQEPPDIETTSVPTSTTVGLQSAVPVPAGLWLKRAVQVFSALNVAGRAALGVALSAELFRSGVPLMPYFGLNNLEVAQPSVQSIYLDHEYTCEETVISSYATPGAQYLIDATLSLPGVLTSNIQANALIGMLFQIGIGVQLFSQVCLRGLSLARQHQLIESLAPAFADVIIASASPKEVSEWLAKGLHDHSCISAQSVQIVSQQIQAHIDPAFAPKPTAIFSNGECPSSSMVNSVQSAREAGINLLDRLANTALISSYAARLITTGIPFISTGFNGLTAGESVRIPINIDQPVSWAAQFQGHLAIRGRVIIPGSRLEHIVTNLFMPLVASSAALKLFVTATALAHQEGGFRKIAQSMQHRPLKTNAYLFSQMLLCVCQQATGALGAFGLSLFLGAKIAADLVGGSKVESLGNLEGSFAFKSHLTLNDIPVVERQLSNQTFVNKIETIELPNPSQITGLTMMIGGVGGAALIGMSCGLGLLRQKLASITPITPRHIPH